MYRAVFFALFVSGCGRWAPADEADDALPSRSMWDMTPISEPDSHPSTDSDPHTSADSDPHTSTDSDPPSGDSGPPNGDSDPHSSTDSGTGGGTDSDPDSDPHSSTDSGDDGGGDSDPSSNSDSDSDSSPNSSTDSNTDSGDNGGTDSAPHSSTDSGDDGGGEGGTDGGTDGGAEGGDDSGTSSSTDSGGDGGTDGGTDSGGDGSTDGGTDSGGDGGTDGGDGGDPDNDPPVNDTNCDTGDTGCQDSGASEDSASEESASDDSAEPSTGDSDTSSPVDDPADTGDSSAPSDTDDGGLSSGDTGAPDSDPPSGDTGVAPADSDPLDLPDGGGTDFTDTADSNADTADSNADSADTSADTADTNVDSGDTSTSDSGQDSGKGEPPTEDGGDPVDTGNEDAPPVGGDSGGDSGTISDGVVRFVALGDAGMGNTTQYDVGSAMVSVCATYGCDFALYLGDNIYPSGVTSVTDAQFTTKFETPYAALTMPFYVVAGNHDYGGWWSPERVQYQVEYTAYSSKWNMPDTYYSFTEEDVTFFGIDTQAIYLGYGADQETWLPSEIASAATTWKILFGHHPYLSNGPHGNAGEYDGSPGEGDTMYNFFNSYVCGQVDVYFCGHDHVLEWLEPSCGVELILSGGGSSGYGLSGSNPTYFDSEDPGFMWVEISGNTFTGVFYDQDGNELFRQSFTK